MILNLWYVITAMMSHQMQWCLLAAPQRPPSGEWVNYCANRSSSVEFAKTWSGGRGGVGCSEGKGWMH
jgi:hypothetical protein